MNFSILAHQFIPLERIIILAAQFTLSLSDLGCLFVGMVGECYIIAKVHIKSLMQIKFSMQIVSNFNLKSKSVSKWNVKFNFSELSDNFKIFYSNLILSIIYLIILYYIYKGEIIMKQRLTESEVINQQGRKIIFYDAINLMDDDLREFLHNELLVCTKQEFFDAYAKEHKAKFKETWELDKINPIG